MTLTNHTTSLELSIALKNAGWPQEYKICPGCKQEVDLTTCHCGSPEKDSEHGYYGYEGYTHPFTPYGCDCLRSK